MATVKALLNTKYKSKDGTYPIIIRIIDGVNQVQKGIGEKVKESDWNDGEVKDRHPEADYINEKISSEIQKIRLYFSQCRMQGIPVDLSLAFQEVKAHSFTDYLRHRERQHREAGQIVMEDKVKRFIKELTEYKGKEEVYFTELTPDFLRGFETFLMERNTANTRAKKFEFLSKYVENAISEGKATVNHFKSYKIATTPTKKPKLTLAEIEALKDLKLKPGPLKMARDLFLFSYYCKGARFQMVILMKKDAIHNGRLHYTSNKSSRPLSTQIHKDLQAIIDAYIHNDTDTIFGRVNEFEKLSAREKKSVIGSENSYFNARLKEVAKLAGIKVNLSYHIARHSIATHLKQVTDNIHVIKKALGHARTEITERYLDDLDDDVVDAAMKKVYSRKKPGK